MSKIDTEYNLLLNFTCIIIFIFVLGILIPFTTFDTDHFECFQKKKKITTIDHFR